MVFAIEDVVRACAVLSSCVVGSLMIAWFRRPSIIMEAYAWYKIVVANLRIRYTIVDGTTIRYAVRLPTADPNTWGLFSKADIRTILRLQRVVETSSVGERPEESEKEVVEEASLELDAEEVSGVKVAETERENETQRSVVVFVHGFSSDLSTWYGLIRSLDPCETVYCVDLPGHGGSERQAKDKENLSLLGFVRFLRRFIEATQLDSVRVHLVGQSLGGSIVGVYASLYPEHVAGLTLISAAVEPPFVTEFAARLNARDYSWLLPTSLDGCAVVFERNLADTRRAQKIPKQIRMAFLDQRMRKLEFYRTVLDSLNTIESRSALLHRAKDIQSPTQLIWGREDQITHVSACGVLQRELGKRCVRVDLFDRCGHAINEEAGAALYNSFRLFREQLLDSFVPAVAYPTTNCAAQSAACDAMQSSTLPIASF